MMASQLNLSRSIILAGTGHDNGALSDTNSYAEEVAAAEWLAVILEVRRKAVVGEQRHSAEVHISGDAVLEATLPGIADWDKRMLNCAIAEQMSGLEEELGSDTAVESVRK